MNLNPFEVKEKSNPEERLLVSDATFDQLIEAAKQKAINDASVKMLASSKETYDKLMEDLELESFIQGCVIKHLETKLRAAKRIK